MKTLFLSTYTALLAFSVQGQTSEWHQQEIAVGDVNRLELTNYWGVIHIEGKTGRDSIRINVQYDNAEDLNLNQGASAWSSVIEQNTLTISVPEPPNDKFESYHINLEIPENMGLKLQMIRGGEIEVNNVKGHIEIDNHNGSTRVRQAASWVTINNFNGEVKVSYEKLAQVDAISLITFNGGIQLMLPQVNNANVILQTKKNGYIHSDFPVVSTTGQQFSNMSPTYIKSANQWQGQIGNGGIKIIAITHNGPVEILKSK